MEGAHLSEFVPIVNSLSHNEKHRNQQLTDYGANLVGKKDMKNPIYPTRFFSDKSEELRASAKCLQVPLPRGD